jgi:fucose permease
MIKEYKYDLYTKDIHHKSMQTHKSMFIVFAQIGRFIYLNDNLLIAMICLDYESGDF